MVLKIPFKSDGSMALHEDDREYVRIDDRYRCVPLEWRDNYEFDAPLRVTGIDRYTSGMRATVEDQDGHMYVMPGSVFEALFFAGRFSGSTVDGRWTFGKRGSYYGIRPVEGAPCAP